MSHDHRTQLSECHALYPIAPNIWKSTIDGQDRYWFVSGGSHEGPDGVLFAYWDFHREEMIAVGSIRGDQS